MNRISTSNKKLDYLFPVIRIIDCNLASTLMFSGMLLDLRWIKDDGIAIFVTIRNEAQMVGLMPKGMIPHLEQVMERQDEFCVQLDRIDCTQLQDSM